MKTYSSLLLIIAVLVTALTACEKNITVDLPQPESKIVVEGYVEIDFPVYVYLSYSTAYFAPIDSASLVGYSIKGATVIISNGTKTDTMQEVIPGQGYFYAAFNMLGEAGKTYTLKVITTDGDSVTATTTVPQPIPLDSVWFKVQQQDTLGFAWAHLTDPVVTGNCYRWFAKRLNRDSSFIAPSGSAFDDKFINGTSFDFAYNRGYFPNDTSYENDPAPGFYNIKDTIVIRFCAMDIDSYKFWRSAENQAGNNGNPFASPAPITSNIKGGLGVFCGYAASYDTIYGKQ